MFAAQFANDNTAGDDSGVGMDKISAENVQ